ncbi:hypothetical protein [Streptomyces sp. NPDC060322]|uniref:hypothetical protein n=1 Tax=Streptomyces sp. NPDC060322 TaxID=3347097 RepID=UPI003648C1A7
MTDTTSAADQLRAAAAQLRALATAASTDTDGRPTAHWAVRYQPGVTPGAAPLTDRNCYLDAIDEADPDGRGARRLLHGGGGSRTRPPSVEPQHGRYIALMDPTLGLALAAWLESWVGVDLSEHGPMPEDAQHALAVARQVLGTTTEQPETEAPAVLPEVWTVWREDEPVYAHYVTEEDAKQGTIDCWQEGEPSCPDYSWRKDGPRLELVVGGEHGGVYASRHRVYGAPPAAPAVDRATVLREAASLLVDHAVTLEALSTSDYDNESFAASHLRGKAVDLHRLAAEAKQPTPDVAEEPAPPAPRILIQLCEQHRPVLEPDPAADGQHLVSCQACDGTRKQIVRLGLDPIPECRFWAMGKAYGYVKDTPAEETK